MIWPWAVEMGVMRSVRVGCGPLGCLGCVPDALHGDELRLLGRCRNTWAVCIAGYICQHMLRFDSASGPMYLTCTMGCNNW
jgi:hypothetical protein